MTSHFSAPSALNLGSPPNFLRAICTSEEQERRFHHSLDLLCVAGIDGYFRQVNPSWTRVLGWTEKELMSRPTIEFVHPDDHERTLQARANLGQGIALSSFENRYLCKDGT